MEDDSNKSSEEMFVEVEDDNEDELNAQERRFSVKNLFKIKGRFTRSKKYYIIEGIRKVIMVAALCVFTYSAYELTNKYLDYKEGDDAYDDIENMFNMPDINGDGEGETDINGNLIKNSNAEKQWNYNFQTLLNMNTDAQGWIKQDNIISYPIVKGVDNDYYLTHNAAHKENQSGAIFVDSRINEGLEAKNCIIYGHDMLNNSMFGSLIQYDSKSYYKNHPTFDIYVGEKAYKYHIFATYETEDVSDTYDCNFESDEEFQKYIDQSISHRLYETEVKSVTTADKIITLSTCTRGNQSRRFIVQMVRGEEIKYK